jgi:hypothetical protein
MRLIGLTAAGLCAAGVVLFATSGNGAVASNPAIKHSCSAQDRQFIREARTNMIAVATSGHDFVTGEGSAATVIRDARRAEIAVAYVRPTDDSLDKARILMRTMFREYGVAVKKKTKNREAGPHIYRAYGLANLAREILVEAQPGLKQHGCDVTGLL